MTFAGSLSSTPWLAFLLEHLLTIAGFLLAMLLITQILRQQRRPTGAMAWVLAIVLIPYIGVPLYLLFGGRKLQRMRRRKTELREEGFGADALEAQPRCNAERVLMAAGMPPTRQHNGVTLRYNGESAYQELMDLIASARHSIHAMTFILGHDDVGREVVRRLADKAAEGVEVRLLLDGLGCIRTSRRFVQPLRDAGGHVAVFLPMLPLRRKWSANLRNHRKIVVVDGEAAMVGGMNLSNTFMGPRPEKTRFLDSAVFLRGPAVGDIEEVFTSDWYYVTDEWIEAPPKPVAAPPPGDSEVQVVASGPDVPEDTLHDALVTAIMDARKRIWVLTPYFVPDETITKALSIQARMGRDVVILVPAKSNHRIADLARGPALRRLHEAGVRVFLYTPGMVHAKLLLFDDILAVTGSPNLDMRSMYINFEIALFHYSQKDIEKTEAWMRDLLNRSMIFEPRRGNLIREWAEGLSALASPLL